MPNVVVVAPSTVVEGAGGTVSLTFLNVSSFSTTIYSREGAGWVPGAEAAYFGSTMSVSGSFVPPRNYTVDIGTIGAYNDDFEINHGMYFIIEISASGQTFDNGQSTYLFRVDIEDNDRAGTNGRDVMYGDSGMNMLLGLGGNDTIYGGAGYDMLDGGSGDDRIFGQSGNDTLRGGDGNDLIDGGLGYDWMVGGSGNDTYYVDYAMDANGQLDEVFEGIGGGTDIVFASISYVLPENVEHLTLTGSRDLNGTGNSSNNRITGNTGDNVLSGMAGNDSLRGAAGADTLDGGDGDDFLRGGTGADVMIGGAGDDRYEVDDAGDQVVEASSSGRDWVYSSISYVLPANVEALTLTGEDWINATGNTKGNAIYGNSGRNVITGGRGSDVMTGKASSDTFVFTSILDSTLDDPDRITDLNDKSDKLDFRQIDGDVNTAGVQGFTIVDAFTGHAGELVLSYDASTDITSLTVDVNGDGVVDMLVRLNGEHESFDRFLFGGG